ncbi:(deoxy)nucleoside triphosphate pyrophosphohydrolase [Pyxidicoccus sp. 3LG]
MARRHVRVVGAMLQNEQGCYLITQRPPKASLPLLWEFPGGRVEEGEEDTVALAREIREEMGVAVEVLDQAMHTHHEYPTYDIDFRVFHCRLAEPEANIRHLRVHDHRWVSLEEMSKYRFPDADAKTLAKLLDLDA